MHIKWMLKKLWMARLLLRFPWRMQISILSYKWLVYFHFAKNYLWTYNRVDREGNANERSHKSGDVCLQKGVLFCHICYKYIYLYIANIVILTWLTSTLRMCSNFQSQKDIEIVSTITVTQCNKRFKMCMSLTPCRYPSLYAWESVTLWAVWTPAPHTTKGVRVSEGWPAPCDPGDTCVK